MSGLQSLPEFDLQELSIDPLAFITWNLKKFLHGLVRWKISTSLLQNRQKKNYLKPSHLFCFLKPGFDQGSGMMTEVFPADEKHAGMRGGPVFSMSDGRKVAKDGYSFIYLKGYSLPGGVDILKNEKIRWTAGYLSIQPDLCKEQARVYQAEARNRIKIRIMPYAMDRRLSSIENILKLCANEECLRWNATWGLRMSE